MKNDVRDDAYGGPAFPHWDVQSGQCFNGMSQRAYFAAAALHGLIASEYGVRYGKAGLSPAQYTAQNAVALADALLAELEKE